MFTHNIDDTSRYYVILATTVEFPRELYSRTHSGVSQIDTMTSYSGMACPHLIATISRMKKVRVCVRYLVLLGVSYCVIRAIANGISDDENVPIVWPEMTNLLPYQLNQEIPDAFGTSISGCKRVIDLVFVVLGPDETRDFSFLLKTLIYFRHDALQLHIISDESSKKILHRLLSTWELPCLRWIFVPVDVQYLVHSGSSRTASIIPHIPRILPPRIVRVIYLHNTVRLLSDVGILWDQFAHFSRSQEYGTQASEFVQENTFSIVMMKLTKLRKHLPDLKAAQSSSESKHTLQTLWGSTPPYSIPCTWFVYASSPERFASCTGKDITKGLILKSTKELQNDSPLIKETLATLRSLLSYDGELFRNQTISACPIVSKTTTNPFPKRDQCREYRVESALKRRTHMNFIASEEVKAEPNDVTILTQFTLDRFQIFQRFMSLWKGPTVVVLHVTDEEALLVEDLISQSNVLRDRKDISYHLVYKREIHYPINYLRNVAMLDVRTPYLLFVDVDLVPNRDLYPMLKAYIKTYMAGRDNVTLVVPAFEAFQNLSRVPEDKSELLSLIENKKADGYRMQRGWNLGHKPTDFPKWKVTNKSYKIKWRNAFEPYVVLPTKMAPPYSNTLLERMADKIAYGREVYAQGFTFIVLPDVFIIHIPHEPSKGTQIWKKNKTYFRCGAVLFNEYSNDLKKKHPKIKF